MKAIILAGGQGVRLREVLPDLPKPMAPVAGRPFLEYLLLQLKRYGVFHVVLATGYKREVIRAYFGDGKQWGMHIDYSEEEVPLGTGGALKQAATLIFDDRFLVMNGDSFLDVDLAELSEFHESRAGAATLSLVWKNDAGRYGSVAKGDDHAILSFSEKGSQSEGFINGGVYCLNRSILDRIGKGNISFERDVLTNLLGGDAYGMEVNGFFVDMGLSTEYRSLCDHPEHLMKVAGL